MTDVNFNLFRANQIYIANKAAAKLITSYPLLIDVHLLVYKINDCKNSNHVYLPTLEPSYKMSSDKFRRTGFLEITKCNASTNL